MIARSTPGVRRLIWASLWAGGLLAPGLVGCDSAGPDPSPVADQTTPDHTPDDSGSDPTAQGEGGDPLTVTVDDDLTVSGCEVVHITGQTTGTARGVAWDVVDYPLLSLLADDELGVRFTAPAVARETAFRVRLSAEGDGGAVVSDEATITVLPGIPESGLAAGLVHACGPFRFGVASGDPDASSVRLWTHITPDDPTASIWLDWVVSTDPLLLDPVQSGRGETDANQDFTLTVEVGDLSPGTTYYYQFSDPNGARSSLGRTRTAPAGQVSEVRIAVASCASLFSGFFNAYRRIADRPNLDLVLHLGDYIYNSVDPEEEVRVPDPWPVDPGTLEEWRDRHALYLTDPDLRLARAMHPWMVIWDNHDLEASTPGAGVQAFREWVPMRLPDPDRPEIAYRAIRYGDLVHLVLLDVLLHRDVDVVPETDELSILGDEAVAWLEAELDESTAVWRVIGTQKVFGTIIVPALIGGGVFDDNTWDGYPADRTRFLDLLTARGLNNNVILSGDSHITVALDLVDDPANPDAPYDPATGDQSAGVELLATSISRGNFDETLGGGEDDGALEDFIDLIAEQLLLLNPHHRFLDLTQHGYGVLHIQSEGITAEVWYSEILTPRDEETLGAALTVGRDLNQWTRE